MRLERFSLNGVKNAKAILHGCAIVPRQKVIARIASMRSVGVTTLLNLNVLNKKDSRNYARYSPFNFKKR